MNTEKCSNISKTKLRRDYLLYTILIYSTNFAYGISGSLIGSVVVDLSFIYQTSLNTMSYVQCFACLGYLIGSLASFTIFRWVDRQLALIYFMFQWTIALTLIPFYGHLWLAFLMATMMTLGTGAWDSSTSIWVVEMWPVGNAALLQGLQFMYGLGTIVAPLLVSPFVYGTKNVTSSNDTISPEDRVHSLTIPFGINASFQAIFPFLFLIMFVSCRYEKSSSKVEKHSSEKNEFTFVRNRKAKLTLLAFCAATYVAAEFGYISFCSAMYQYLEIHLEADTAAHVQSIMATTFTFGRLLTAFISLKLRPDLILAYHYAILLLSIGLLYFGRFELRLIYVANAVLGYGFSAIWPGLFAFTQHYLRLTDQTCSVFAFLSGATSLLVPFVLGQTFITYPVILILIIAFFVSISFVLFIAVRIWIWIDSRTQSINLQVKTIINDQKKF